MCKEMKKSENFIETIVEKDLMEGNCSKAICTRFPPEPNGYLHIGNAYAINISYTVAKKFGGEFNLRFDDTNPVKEDEEYVKAIKEDMRWMEFNWDGLFYGSDYSNEIFDYAVDLIKKGKAFVCDLSSEEIRKYRGTLKEVGNNSPFRDRTVEENLKLFYEMQEGKYKDGEKVLRAKIDMNSPNMNMRDPVIYRILHREHYRTGDKWCIYPMYDFAHPLQDAIEGITHSLCSIEFKDHRPLYEWVINSSDIKIKPKQREFGRMNLRGVITSKRYLRALVEEEWVDGWDDPRMPTLCGMRRRGYTPEAINEFLKEIGVSKAESVVHRDMLDHCVRNDLKEKSPRIMCVVDPIKVVITNYPEGKIEWLKAENNSDNVSLGKRKIPFSRTLYIEKDDFMENPSSKYFRLTPGKEVRLKYAYFIKCESVIRDDNTDEIVEIRCTYDPETKSGSGFKGRKVKSTIHWVSANEAVKCKVNFYENLLMDESESLKEKWREFINPKSLKKYDACYIEHFINEYKNGEKFQFLRHGYFCIDAKNTKENELVFNRIVSLKSSWKK